MIIQHRKGKNLSAISKKNWAIAFEKMRDELALDNDSLGVFASHLKFGISDFQATASESITGGNSDKKCDVILIDRERDFAVIAQCYVSEKTRVSAPSNKASDLNTAVSWVLSSEIEDLPESLMAPASELREGIRSGEIKSLHIWYVHNLPASQNVSDELKVVEKTAKQALKQFKGHADINVFSEEVSDELLEEWYVLAERAILVTDEFETRVPNLVEIKSDDWSSIVTAVSARWLHDVFQAHQTNLFSANLRGYLGSRKSEANINNGIKKSASEEPDNFFVYNNGVTALVLDYEIGRKKKGGIPIKIQGISIVNGAQTTGSLSSLGHPPDDSIIVPMRFVKSSNENIINKIVRYNNSQNKLQAADFRSTDPIQERLRTEFSVIPNAEYDGGRRGGASDVMKRSKFALPSYTVAQALAAFHGEPVTAYDKKSELWTSEKNYRQIFTDRTTARHIVFCYSLLGEILTQKMALQRKSKETPSAMTAQDKQHLEFLQKKGANFLLVHAISQSIETILDKAIPNRFDLKFKPNSGPESAQKHWKPIVTTFLALSSQLDSAFSQNRISNETVNGAMPAFTGIITSLAGNYEAIFSKFRGVVSI